MQPQADIIYLEYILQHGYGNRFNWKTTLLPTPAKYSLYRDSELV